MIYLTDGFFLFTIWVLLDYQELKSDPVRQRPLSNLSGDRFCFLISTSAPELSECSSRTMWRSPLLHSLQGYEMSGLGNKVLESERILRKAVMYRKTHQKTVTVGGKIMFGTTMTCLPTWDKLGLN